MISEGALSFEGFTSQACHTSRQHTRYFAFAGTIDGDDPPGPSSESRSLSRGLSLVLGRHVDGNRPWETLEQPSMTLCFGGIPGSITLNRYVGLIGRSLEDEQSTSMVTRREMSLRNVLDRLDCLQHGLDNDVSRRFKAGNRMSTDE